MVHLGLSWSWVHGQSATDQYGNIVPLDSLRWPTPQEVALRGGGAFCTSSGIFEVYFRDVDWSTGVGSTIRRMAWHAGMWCARSFRTSL